MYVSRVRSKNWRCRARVTPREIALVDSRRLRSTLAATPVLFAYAVVTASKKGSFIMRRQHGRSNIPAGARSPQQQPQQLAVQALQQLDF